MAEIKELVEQVRTLQETINTNNAASRENDKRMQEEITKYGDASASLKETADKLDTEFAETRSAQTELVKRLEQLELTLQAPEYNSKIQEISEDERRSILSKAVRSLHPEMGEQFKLSTEELRKLYGDKLEERQLAQMVDSMGGVTVTPDFENQLHKSEYALGGFRKVVNAKTTGKDRAVILTMGSVTTSWLGELETVTDQDVSFGNITIPIHAIRALVKIPNDLLDDTEADLWGELADCFAKAIAVAEDTAFCSGNGVKKPMGLFVDATLQTSGNYYASGVAADIFDSTHNGVDNLRLMRASLLEVYRRMGSWMMNSLTEAKVRNLKDAYGQYLYHAAVAVSGPTTFDGSPVNIVEACPDIAANAFPIAFGAFNEAYAIRDRAGLKIVRDDSVYRTTDQVGMFVKKRLGGGPVITGTPAVKLFKVAAS